MRLTLVITSLERGGAERAACDLAGAWVEQGKDVTILTLDRFGEPAYALDPAVQLKRATLEQRWPAPLRKVAQKLWRIGGLRRAIREARPDVVISFMDRPNVLALLATRGLKAPVVISEWINPSLYRIGPVWSGLRRLLYPRAHALVCQTSTTLECFTRKIDVAGYAIPSFVNLPFAAGVNSKPARNGSGRLIIGMGRLVPQKGFDLLLDAFARVAGRHPEWSVKILGDGPQRDQIERQAASLGLKERVRFAGAVRDPFAELRAADLFVFSSRFEGFGLALLEAMACGLPVISFDCPSGPRDMIRNGVDGVLVKPQDVASLAAAMDQLMSDQQERERLADRAPEVMERFSKKEILTLWERVIHDVMERSPAGTNNHALGESG
jgi:glycosyltransferase involved in cell wall biosynthesis